MHASCLHRPIEMDWMEAGVQELWLGVFQSNQGRDEGTKAYSRDGFNARI